MNVMHNHKQSIAMYYSMGLQQCVMTSLCSMDEDVATYIHTEMSFDGE